MYGSVITLGEYHNASSQGKPVSKDQIVKALKTCIIQHPVLSTIVQDPENERSSLAQVAELDLDEHIRFRNIENGAAESLQEFLGSAHNEALPPSSVRPQWRVYMASTINDPSKTLIAFAVSHNLVDGRSGLIFHRTLLEALRALATNTHSSEPFFSLPSARKPLPLPTEQVGALSISWSFFLRMISNEFLPSSLSSLLGLRPAVADKIWHGAPARPPIHAPISKDLVQTTLRIITLSAETTSSVLATCKANRARLTGLLVHIFARALAQALHAWGQEYTNFMAQMPLDLRRALATADSLGGAESSRLRELDNTMANYVSGCTDTISLSSEQISSHSPIEVQEQDWAAMRTTTNKLAAASATLIDQPVGALKYLSDMRAWTLKRAASPAEGSFEVSNLGVFAGSAQHEESLEHDGWEVKELGFSQSADATGLPITFNVASAFGGGLRIVVSWWPGMLGVEDEGDFVDEVCRRVEEALKAIANPVDNS